jgi:hypothetical protein
MRRLFAIILFIGLLIVGVEIGKKSCKPKTIYQYIPRTPQEEEESLIDVEDIFKDMFQKSTPWIKSNDEDKFNLRKIVF